MFVEVHDSVERLILSRSGHVLVSCEVAQELSNLLGSHLSWVLASVKRNKPLGPMGICFLGKLAHMREAHLLSHYLEESLRLARGGRAEADPFSGVAWVHTSYIRNP